jgi:hypothetical protein
LENEYDVVLFWQFLVPNHFSHLQQYGGVAVMSAAVPDGQCVNIATDGYGGQGTVRAPHGYDSKTSHMGVDGIGMGRSKMLHNQVVGKMLVTRYAGMVVKLVSYVGVCHF